jgi:methionyl-tRNA formyltransferase
MLKTILVTQDDPFYVLIFFKELLKNDLSKKFDLKGVIIQPPLGKKSKKKLIKQMLDFYGYWNFTVIGFKYVFFKIFNYLSIKISKGHFPGAFSVEHLLLKNNINIFELKNINSKESITFLKSLGLDVIFSIAASQIFKEEILKLPKFGCYNIHTAKLPKNRGMMPNFWSLYNYDTNSGSAITIHRMNRELDDGEILLQQEFQLDPHETLDSLIKRTKKMSVQTFLNAMDLLTKGDFSLKANDQKFASYNTFPTKEDVKRFKAKGLKLI